MQKWKNKTSLKPQSTFALISQIWFKGILERVINGILERNPTNVL
jgi:hypothetical protein